MISKRVFVGGISGSVLVLDQLSKWAIRQTMPLYESIPVIDAYFHLTHVRNSGGAFSLLADAGEAIRLPFFFVASALAVGALLYFVRQVGPQQRVLLFALAGILGGALGNLVDRVVAGQVTDFLDLHWRGYHWPAFNVADSFITVGVTILLLHSLFVSDQPTDRPGAPSA